MEPTPQYDFSFTPAPVNTFTLTGPVQGPKGEKGDKGDPGEPGATGAAGTSDHTLLTNIGTNTHAQIDTALTRLAATSGTNTGDQDLTAYETTTQLNARDTANRSRTNHTGTQAISTVTGLQVALDGKQATGDYATNTALTNGLAAKSDTTHAHAVNDLSDVTVTTPTSGQVLKFNGTAWINDTDTGGTTVSDATTTTKGVIQLAGDLGGTAIAPTVPALTNFETTTQLNSRDTANRNTDNHVSGTTNKVFSATEQTKLTGIEAGAQVNVVTSVATKTGAVTLVKADVGLSNVDNTADTAKPVSTAQQTALDAKLNASVISANGKGYIAHGATATTARPTGYASIEWVGSVEPTNATTADTWIDVS